MTIDCYVHIFFNVATADTSHNSLNTWECVLLNRYHKSDLLQSQYIPTTVKLYIAWHAF